LTGRIVLASAVVMLLALSAYAALFLVIFDLRSSSGITRRSEVMLAEANRMEWLVTDLGMGARGYILTGDEHSLRPWEDARAALPREAASMERLAASTDAAQMGRAQQFDRDVRSFIQDYGVPLVATVRRDPHSSSASLAIVEGERRLIILRGRLERIKAVQRRIAEAHDGRADQDARQATLIAAAGAVGALSLIFFFSGYLNRAVLRPVRRTSAMADVVARGDLDVRVPETSRHEVGRLEHVFNAMASSLETSQDDQRRYTEEQRALRLIATLVARRLSPSEIFTIVARELGRVQRADYTVINRFEPGRFVSTVGHWTAPGVPGILPPLDGHWALEDDTAIGKVFLTGRPARVSFATSNSRLGVWNRERGIHHVVAAPITAGGRLWGIIAIFSLGHKAPHADTEGRLLGFVELLSTTIANAENRNELLASSARIVRASEAACDRIEADLSDVAQRRLTSLESGLRAIQQSVPAEQVALSDRLDDIAGGLRGVLDDLQEISRGVRPLSGNLRSALHALTQRSGIPIDLEVRIDRTLSGHVEQTIYYTVSEALANVAKYARASKVRIDLAGEDTALRLRVRDDGVGGADPSSGSGLTGLKDRIESCGGTMEITSPTGQGTSLLVTIPTPGT
jgi:signal transduction histidine kinase